MAIPPLAGEHRLLPEALTAAAAQFGDRDAYVEPGRVMGFAEWRGRSQRLATWLAAAGVRRGDVVAIMVPSSADFAIAYTAAITLGAIATGINTRLGPDETLGILELSAARVLVCEEAQAHLATSRGILPLLRDDIERLSDLGTADGTIPAVEAEPTDPAIIIWTSGTTGMPKGAWYDHAALEAAVHSAGVMSAPHDRRLVATPFAHAGYMAKVWDQLAWGVTFVIPPSPWSAASMADTLREERITVAAAVPTQWAKLLEQPLSANPPFPSLRLGIAATAPASPDLVEAVRDRLGVPLVVRYAMTESPSIAGTDPDDAPEVQFRTVGRAQPGMEVRILDGAGNLVTDGSVGAISTRGTCVMRGYWHDPERTAQAIDAEGWLSTGDLGTLDGTGLLTLTGRSGDMYIRGGYNVYPLEVEKVLDAHPGVKQAAVVGTAASVIGEIGVAFVVPTATPPSLDDVRTWVRSHLADYKAPDELILLDELPLTGMLKVDRVELRARAREARRRER